MARTTDRKVVLITGASDGIGFASAMALRERGHTVYGAARRVERMDPLVSAGGHAIEMDVTSDDDVRSGVQRVLDEQGRVDGLFANAGYCLLGDVETVPTSEVVRQFDTNVFGVGRAIREVLPAMRTQGSGTIAICSSVAGHVGMPAMAWYPATKFALQGLGHSLRMEVAEFGIAVALIEPGAIATGIVEASLPTLDASARHPSAPAYAHHRDKLAERWSAMCDNGASPDTIAAVVVEAFVARRPRRSYHPNTDARAGILLRRLTGYALIDRLMPRQLLH